MRLKNVFGTVVLASLAWLVLVPESGALPEAASPGYVFTSTNDPSGNEVFMYRRSPQGTLTLIDSFATMGTGTGTGLGNQGAVTLTEDHRFLLVVNAGSNDVSVFRVRRSGLTLTDEEPSGGMTPVSVTVYEDLVYVLNAGGEGNISGFTLTPSGDLIAIPDSTRPLSGAPMPAPAQVQFSPDGTLLVVTEKMTNLIDTYTVDENGLATGPMVQPSSGVEPFGMNFSPQGWLIVAEAFNGAPDASAVSSYAAATNGALDVISPSVPTTETAACWIAIVNSGRFAYTTNTGSGTITGFRVGSNGSLSILDADGVTAVTGPGSAPTDIDFNNSSKYLYALNSGTGEIDVFKVNLSNGRLTPIQSIGGIPPMSTGLAAW
jgi:6-phosphogluconolactonase